MEEVLEPTVECSKRLACIYPPQAVAIVNSNFDMAPLGLLVHAGGFQVCGRGAPPSVGADACLHAAQFQPERRFNAALFSALHTSELAVQDAGPAPPTAPAPAPLCAAEAGPRGRGDSVHEAQVQGPGLPALQGVRARGRLEGGGGRARCRAAGGDAQQVRGRSRGAGGRGAGAEGGLVGVGGRRGCCTAPPRAWRARRRPAPRRPSCPWPSRPFLLAAPASRRQPPLAWGGAEGGGGGGRRGTRCT